MSIWKLKTRDETDHYESPDQRTLETRTLEFTKWLVTMP